MPPWVSEAQQAITIESNWLEVISGCEAEPKFWAIFPFLYFFNSFFPKIILQIEDGQK
jgi:hypothetical protein